jgi:hypothetical protein
MNTWPRPKPWADKLDVPLDNWKRPEHQTLASWDQLERHRLSRKNPDRTWVACRFVVLLIGTAFLCTPIERRLSELFTTPLSRWDLALYGLLRTGLPKRDADPVSD